METFEFAFAYTANPGPEVQSRRHPRARSRLADSFLPSTFGDCRVGPDPHQAPLRRDDASSVAGPFQDMHLEGVSRCHSFFSRRALFLDTNSLTDRFHFWVRYRCPDGPTLISLGNLKIPSSPGTILTDAAFPRRASLPFNRQLCHCENRAAPIGSCPDGRQLAGRPGLAPNHKSKPGRPKPTCRRSRALAYPRAQLRNVKSAAGRPPQGLTTQPYRLRLFSWPFSPLCLLAPLSHPWRSHTSSCYHPPSFKELVREPMHYRCTTDCG
jgi:hypothetical protein